MEHHMFEYTGSITLYLTYAALMMGLIVCSILSPIRTVTVDSRQLRLYGVTIAYQTPPAGWNQQLTDPLESSSGSSSSSSSSVEEAENRGGGTALHARVLQEPFRPAAMPAFLNTSTEGSNLLVGEDEEGSPPTARITSLAPCKGREATKSIASRHHATERLHRTQHASVYDGTALRVEKASAPQRINDVVSAFSDSSSSDQDSSSAVLSENRTHWMSLRHVPSSSLARCMTAYLVFAYLCLLFSLLLIVTLFLQLLPTKAEVPLRTAMQVFAVASPLSAILCFVMAAVLGLRGRLVRHIAEGYYVNSASHEAVSRLRSGFSTTVAAAFIALAVVLLSPVIWKQ